MRSLPSSNPPDVVKLQTVPGVVVPGFYPGGLGVSGTGATEATRFHPEFGYTHWQAKQTFDNRLGLSRGNVPAVTERGFHRIKIKFDHDSEGPIPYGVNDGTQFFASHGALRWLSKTFPGVVWVQRLYRCVAFPPI